MPRSAPAPRSRGRPAGRVVTTRSATASRGRPTTRPGPSQPRQRAATQPASPPPDTTPPNSDLRQQFDSLRQTVEGLVGVVQQLATQAATREATTPAVTAATPPDVAAPVYLLPTAATSTTSDYMPPPGAPPPTPLAELAAPSGESNAVPVVLQHHTRRPILFAAGLPAGYHISEKLKVRIWNNKYIDFNDITSNASNRSTYTMSSLTTARRKTAHHTTKQRHTTKQTPAHGDRMVHCMGRLPDSLHTKTSTSPHRPYHIQ